MAGILVCNYALATKLTPQQGEKLGMKEMLGMKACSISLAAS
jgi:hypothetical protein